MQRYTRMLATTALVSVIGGPSFAATGSSTAANDPAAISSQIETVTVTAQKRSQSAGAVGMAITALTGDQLKMLGVGDLTAIMKVDPSFAIAQGNWGGVTYQIRGVGYNDFSMAASPTVSVYTDQIPYAYPNMSKGATFDLERVEVLKGPQGTLFGQNSTGGAVNYIAAKPTDTLTAGIDATYSRFDATDINGFISGPISDTVSARLAFKVDEGGAWQKSYTRNDRLGDKDAKFARAIVDWTPTDKLKVSINVNGWTDNSATQAGQLQGVYLGKPQYAGQVLPEVNAPVAPHNAQAADWLAGTHPANDESYVQGSVDAEYTVSDHLKLTYLGTYEYYRQNDLQEPEGINAELYLLQGGTVRATSHELRASGTFLNGKVDWLFGGNYAENLTHERQLEDVGGTTSGYSLTPLTGGIPFASFINQSRDDSTSEAAFANVEYHFTPQFGMHAGLRYTQTDISHGGCTRDDGDGVMAFSFTAYEAHLLHGVGVVPLVPGGCITLDSIHPTNYYHPTYTNQVLNQGNVSWTIGLNWTPNPEMLIYATASKGYKAGSFPTLAAIFSGALRPVTQEAVQAYEVGIKSHFLDRRLELDGDVFHYNYTNKQLEMRRLEGVFGLLNTLVNIPDSTVTGVELAVKTIPVSGLELTFRGTYLDATISKSFMGYNPFSTTPLDLNGESFPNTPKWAVSGSAQYDFELNSELEAFIGADARYQSGSQGEFGSYEAIAAGYSRTPSPLNVTAPLVQPGSLVTVNDAYAVGDIRAGVYSQDGHYTVQVFVNNVANTYYWTQARLAGDAVVRFAGMPRVYGVTLGYRY